MEKLIGPRKIKTAVFISGNGSNLKNIIKFSCQDSKSSTKLDTKVFCREIYIKNKKNSWK